MLDIRRIMPRISVRKLYHLLQEPLAVLGVGRDKIFDVLRANHLLVVPKRQYRQTTLSKHLYYKHKNLVLNRVPTRPEEFDFSDYRQLKTHRIIPLSALDIQALNLSSLSLLFFDVTLLQDETEF